jgi:2-polyprenyl-6-methoxyphenol hydroxylase-like FAD-dependent oxidoreductase
VRLDAEVVIVGGGIAGGALGTALARAGRSVLILEKTAVHVDRVRGEWLSPWGVVEAKRLDLYDLLVAAGGHHPVRHIDFDELIDPADATASTLDMGSLIPGVPGPLCLGHPAMCDLFDRAATDAGATLVRGAEVTGVRAGTPPEIGVRVDGREHSLRPRLVVGADGRGSFVRRRLGIPLHKDEPHHFMAGLLVTNTGNWPADLQTVGTEGDVCFLVFPQQGSRARLYICYGRGQSHRVSGPEGAARFLDAFRLRSVPGSAALAGAVPAGPCHAYSNEDTWSDDPAAPGVVLVGDAAGYNDPIIGQGLSIALRDVRMVRDLLLDNRDWTHAAFRPYAAERAERMRRLRFSAAIMSVLQVEFDDAARDRRRRALALMENDPELAAVKVAPFIGPEVCPAESFSADTRTRLLAA